MITGYDLAEYLFSDNEEERLYSTGNEELDELLERAFSEGYEYAQREFGKKKEQSIRKDAGTGALIGGASAAGLGTYYARKYLKEVPWKASKEQLEMAKNSVRSAEEMAGRSLPKNKFLRKLGKIALKYPKASALGAAGITAGTIGAGVGSGIGSVIGTGRKVVRKVRNED